MLVLLRGQNAPVEALASAGSASSEATDGMCTPTHHEAWDEMYRRTKSHAEAPRSLAHAVHPRHRWPSTELSSALLEDIAPRRGRGFAVHDSSALGKARP